MGSDHDIVGKGVGDNGGVRVEDGGDVGKRRTTCAREKKKITENQAVECLDEAGMKMKNFT